MFLLTSKVFAGSIVLVAPGYGLRPSEGESSVYGLGQGHKQLPV